LSTSIRCGKRVRAGHRRRRQGRRGQSAATRPVAFILSGFMAAAYFMAHFPMSFFPAINMREAALLYCFIFLYLAAAGPGPWSIDRE
jgi:hypothetical protein